MTETMTWKNFSGFIKKHIKETVYVCVAVVTLILVCVLFPWAAAGKVDTSIVTKQATVVADSSAITEYLAGEKPRFEGLTLTLEDGRVIESDKLEAETEDFTLSAAGEQRFDVMFKEDNVYHVGTFDVKVFTVRQIDLNAYPTQAVKKIDGSYSIVEKYIRAELGEVPTSGRFAPDYEHPEWRYCIMLPAETYTIPDTTEVMNAQSVVRTAKFSVQFTFRNEMSLPYLDSDLSVAQTAQLTSAIYVQSFYNWNTEDNAMLTCYMTQYALWPPVQGQGKHYARGFYLYEKTVNGQKEATVLPLTAYTEWQWASAFDSQGIEESFSVSGFGTYDGDHNGLLVRYDGRSFLLSRQEWTTVLFGYPM